MSEITSVPVTGHIPHASFTTEIPQGTDCLLVACFTGEDGLELAGTGLFDDEVDIEIWRQLVNVGATGAKEELTVVPGLEATGVPTVAAIGLGDSDDVEEDTLRRAAGVAARGLKGYASVATTIGAFGLGPAVEGFVLGGYHYPGYRKQDDSATAKKPVETVAFIHTVQAIAGETAPEKKQAKKAEKKAKEVFVRALINAEQVCFARDLVNTPPLDLYPASYAEIAKKAAKAEGLKVEVLDFEELKKKGFGGIVAVGQGSSRSPRLVRISYQPKKATTTVALVGKGITFDTGGISLKPGANMDAMTSDMAGSAAVVAAVVGAARLKLNVAVTATVPLAENMPGGSAQRPGDVIRHYGGVTSEVLNTDAEGRLVLADAIARACEDKPDYLIETATLTGAQLVALGTRTTGVMGSDDFRDRVAAHGRAVGETAWAMPIPEEVKKDVYSSDIADVRNIAKARWAGMQAAGAYLEKFVADGVEWTHLDVAGPAYNQDSPWGYSPKRATGCPVRTILATLADIADNG
ncbi:leucyl aminopeptidase [Corynebacterium mendelii]|uniref:leucyl aminopeptidase n=1 Tax=Corynebacterium mendelii TaxID=2765362 RepID=UPI002ED2F845